jgi:hypothetical protein
MVSDADAPVVSSRYSLAPQVEYAVLMAATPFRTMLLIMTRGVRGTSAATTTIHADELQSGDVVVYDGHVRQIVQVDRRDGWAWPIGTDSTGWGIALGDQLIEVRRAAA